MLCVSYVQCFQIIDLSHSALLIICSKSLVVGFFWVQLFSQRISYFIGWRSTEFYGKYVVSYLQHIFNSVFYHIYSIFFFYCQFFSLTQNRWGIFQIIKEHCKIDEGYDWVSFSIWCKTLTYAIVFSSSLEDFYSLCFLDWEWGCIFWQIKRKRFILLIVNSHKCNLNFLNKKHARMTMLITINEAVIIGLWTQMSQFNFFDFLVRFF